MVTLWDPCGTTVVPLWAPYGAPVVPMWSLLSSEGNFLGKSKNGPTARSVQLVHTGGRDAVDAFVDCGGCS